MFEYLVCVQEGRDIYIWVTTLYVFKKAGILCLSHLVCVQEGRDINVWVTLYVFKKAGILMFESPCMCSRRQGY